jgi:hypothetical protein
MLLNMFHIRPIHTQLPSQTSRNNSVLNAHEVVQSVILSTCAGTQSCSSCDLIFHFVSVLEIQKLYEYFITCKSYMFYHRNFLSVNCVGELDVRLRCTVVGSVRVIDNVLATSTDGVRPLYRAVRNCCICIQNSPLHVFLLAQYIHRYL